MSTDFIENLIFLFYHAYKIFQLDEPFVTTKLMVPLQSKFFFLFWNPYNGYAVSKNYSSNKNLRKP